MRHLIVGSVIALTATTISASCFKGLDQRSVAGSVPIIVQGEIVKIDVAKGELKEHGARRYADLAHVRIDKVYKNSLSDAKVEVKGEVTAWMHSVNQSLPGSEQDGKQQAMRVSTDIAYKVGTKAIWFVFLAKDGKFYINRHPQQREAVEKEAELQRAGILAPDREKQVTREKWLTQVSDLGSFRNITQSIERAPSAKSQVK